MAPRPAQTASRRDLRTEAPWAPAHRPHRTLTQVELAARIRAALSVDVQLRTLFDVPTVSALAELLGTEKSTRPALRPMRDRSGR
ncbi:acyl carrier protein [Kitasatospora sp. NPDC004669]|uniref:acyl carrier protein n=1 Tax=Kitasatospora sp. NPDC004669 TaxID=3154555 RepID=UPI0033B8BD22